MPPYDTGDPRMVQDDIEDLHTSHEKAKRRCADLAAELAREKARREALEWLLESNGWPECPHCERGLIRLKDLPNGESIDVECDRCLFGWERDVEVA